ncbi:DNA mismatch repair protein [Collichthys lucidus]|uniref:DNA mismatch repair protein n=1 Tax=Collichthys lucidus TaxID=240159 RepID=A0A4U5VE83_COLLU|nr:DNA mismatch repair protein [Collichthys lucidus]
MIKCLPKEVQGKLRSGVAIPSLQQCVEELILNGIDAEATCVGVRMDMEAFKVQVIDNGAGMNAEDMECVGNRYYTSKCSSVEDLDNLRWYGFRGEALASLVSLATLVEISSRTRSSVKTHVKIFKGGKGMDVFEAETARPSAGTTVVICSFFHNMPVRRKRMDAVLEGERIRHRLEAISLMHPSVSFTLKNDCTGAMMVQLPKARNTYHRFVQIHSLDRAQKLREISHAHGRFEVLGYIGREGHYNNSLQFLYVNDRLLLKTRIHKLLNFLLRRLSSSNQKNDSQESAIRSPKHKRSQELHGVYIINIKCSYSEYDICLEPAKTLIEFKDWDGILLCIEEAVKAFLRRENLVSVFSQEDLDNVSPKLFGTHNAVEEMDNAGSASAVDCDIGTRLASEPVYRKRIDDRVCEDSVCQESGLMECNEEQLGQKITANELAKIGSEGSINKEFRDEPLCELARLEPASDNNITEEEEEPTFSQTGESSQILCCQATGGQEQTAVSHRKISLSDPYIHESLQTRDLSQIKKSVFQQQISASKRKISLDAGLDRSCRKLCKDFAAVIPSKVPRIVTCPKLFLCKESGSLEKFRRVYGKSDELKLSSQRTLQSNNTALPHTDRFILNSQNLLVLQKDQQDVDVTEKEETLSSLSVSITLKPVSAQNVGKTSLAAKLCHLKQHRTDDSKVLPHLSRTSTQDNTCVSISIDAIQDSNNENHCDAAEDLEPVPGSSTDPQLAEREEATTSGDWLHHYDTSVGKTVYVNRVTGLSRFKVPSTEDVRCTSDVTNMAVSVISEMGMEYRCYPFQADLVLPFLPKSRTDRVISSGLDNRDGNSESSNSLTSLYSKWNNPVFIRPPMVGVDISSGQADGLAVKIHNILFPYRFSKDMIHSMKARMKSLQQLLQQKETFWLCLLDYILELCDSVVGRYHLPKSLSGEKELCLSLLSRGLKVRQTKEILEYLKAYKMLQLQFGTLNIMPSFPQVVKVICNGLRELHLCFGFQVKGSPKFIFGHVWACILVVQAMQRRLHSISASVLTQFIFREVIYLRCNASIRAIFSRSVLRVLRSLTIHHIIKTECHLTFLESVKFCAILSSITNAFQSAGGQGSMYPIVDTIHLDLKIYNLIFSAAGRKHGKIYADLREY